MNGASVAPHQALADRVEENLAGQQAAAQLLEQITLCVGDGRELERALDAIGNRPAYRSGFLRQVQKRLERLAIA